MRTSLEVLVPTECSFPFRDQIRENVLSKQFYCDIDIAHLIAFNEHLAHRINHEPAEIIPIVSREPPTRMTTSIPDQSHSSNGPSKSAPRKSSTPLEAKKISTSPNHSPNTNFSSTPPFRKPRFEDSQQPTSPTSSAYPVSSSVQAR